MQLLHACMQKYTATSNKKLLDAAFSLWRGLRMWQQAECAHTCAHDANTRCMRAAKMVAQLRLHTSSFAQQLHKFEPAGVAVGH